MKITDLLTEAKKPTPPKTRSPAAASLADRKYQQKIIPNKKKKIDPKHKKTVGLDEQRSLANPRIVQVADDPQGIYDFAVVGPNHLSIRPFPAHQWNNLQSDARNHGYQLQYIGNDPAKAKAAAWPGETPKPRTMGMKEASSPAQQAAIAVNMKKAGKKPKNESFDDGEPEGETMKNSLHTIVRVATQLDKRVDMNDEFPEWVSEKIGAVKSMMVSVMDYLISDQEMKTFESKKQKGVDGKACWKGYKRMGTKKKGGKTVDNCVPTGK